MERLMLPTARFNLRTEPRRVLLLTRTHRFGLEEDLKRETGIRSRPLSWFASELGRRGVVVEYFALFTEAEKKRFGPVSAKVSDAICARRLRLLYGEDAALVGHVRLAKRFPGIGSLDELVRDLLRDV